MIIVIHNRDPQNNPETTTMAQQQHNNNHNGLKKSTVLALYIFLVEEEEQQPNLMSSSTLSCLLFFLCVCCDVTTLLSLCFPLLLHIKHILYHHFMYVAFYKDKILMKISLCCSAHIHKNHHQTTNKIFFQREISFPFFSSSDKIASINHSSHNILQERKTRQRERKGDVM